MRLYRKYNLSDDVDFIDVELSTDNEQWIDPMMMHMDKSQIGKKCCQIVQQYFEKLLTLAIAKNDTEGYKYTKYFVEMNETRLGYSARKPNGLSGGENLGIEIYNLIKNSKAIYTEMIEDIFDASVMIEGLGVDKMSDFITSLIFEQLIEFTQKECIKHKILMKDVVIKKSYWSYNKQHWVHNTIKKLPYDEESKMAIVFVPKKFVECKTIYSYNRFYSKSMIPFLGKQAVDNRMYGLIRILKDKTIKPHYTKIRKQNPCTRENVNNFITEHYGIYKNYKKRQLEYIGYNNYK